MSVGATISSGLRRLAEHVGLQQPIQTPMLPVAPGEDPGVYRRSIQEINLYTIGDNGSPRFVESAIRPRLSRDRPASNGDRYPDTVLCEIQDPSVTTSTGVLKETASPYVSIVRSRDAVVAAVIKARPTAFAASDWNHFLSSISYLVKQGIFVALDLSDIGAPNIFSNGRVAFRDLFEQHNTLRGKMVAVYDASHPEPPMQESPMKRAFESSNIPVHFVRTPDEALAYLFSN